MDLNISSKIKQHLPARKKKEKGHNNTYSNQKLILALRDKKYPSLKQMKHIFKVFTFQEKKVLFTLTSLILICVVFIGIIFLNEHISKVPTDSGEYIEGIVGYPQLVNPIFAYNNDVDIDLTKLIFSGLLKYDSQLNLVPDLAKSYEIDKEGTIYTFYLRQDVVWQHREGTTAEKFSADDVVFTFEAIKNLEYKSPYYYTFKSVEVNKIDQYTIQFKLKEAYAPFLNVLTLGIISQDNWSSIAPQNAKLADYNLKPENCGTGMFGFDSLLKDKLGNIKSYTLKRNEEYYGKKPYFQKLTFKFFPDFESAHLALKSKDVQGLKFLPKNLRENLVRGNVTVKSLNLPQYTALFLNQGKKGTLDDKNLRNALAMSINRDNILEKDLSGEGIIISGPLLPGLLGYEPNLEYYKYNINEANRLLDEGGWMRIGSENFVNQEQKKIKEEVSSLENKIKEIEKDEKPNSEQKGNIAKVKEEIRLLNKGIEELNEKRKQSFYRQKKNEILTLNLTTVNSEENVKVANSIMSYWENIGILVDLQLLESKDMEEIIKTRNYDILLYGEVIGSDPDLYPFWHSSQINYPGLNLSLFSNKDADKLLEEARRINNPNERKDKYIHFQNILVQEVPVIFLYSPTYSYILSDKIRGFDLKKVYLPQDRFVNIENWYTKTKNVWK